MYFSEYKVLNNCSASAREEVSEGQIVILQQKYRLQTYPEESLSFQSTFTGPTFANKSLVFHMALIQKS